MSQIIYQQGVPNIQGSIIPNEMINQTQYIPNVAPQMQTTYLPNEFVNQQQFFPSLAPTVQTNYVPTEVVTTNQQVIVNDPQLQQNNDICLQLLEKLSEENNYLKANIHQNQLKLNEKRQMIQNLHIQEEEFLHRKNNLINEIQQNQKVIQQNDRDIYEKQRDLTQSEKQNIYQRDVMELNMKIKTQYDQNPTDVDNLREMNHKLEQLIDMKKKQVNSQKNSTLFKEIKDLKQDYVNHNKVEEINFLQDQIESKLQQIKQLERQISSDDPQYQETMSYKDIYLRNKTIMSQLNVIIQSKQPVRYQQVQLQQVQLIPVQQKIVTPASRVIGNQQSFIAPRNNIVDQPKVLSPRLYAINKPSMMISPRSSQIITENVIKL